MHPELKKMLDAMTKCLADGDLKGAADALAKINTWAAGDQAKHMGEAGEVKTALDAMRKDIDAATTTIRRLEKAGLSMRGGQIVIPEGRRARQDMLADGRAFLSDDTARRFGAVMALRMADVNRSLVLPQAVRELAEQVCKDGDMDPAVSASGGYLIPDEFKAELIRNVEAVARVYTQCRRLPLMTGGSTKIPTRAGGLTAYPTDAAAAISRTGVTVGLVTLTPEKWAALTAVPNEFFRNGRLLAELGQWIGVEMVYAFAYAFDNAVVNGDGTSTYGGITGILSSANITSQAAATTHTTLATCTYVDMSSFIAALTKEYAIREARWGMSLSAQRVMRNIRATGGEPLYDRGSNGEPNTIDGYPYTITQCAPAASAITASVKGGWFGDLRMSHVFGMIGDIEIAESEHVYFESDMRAIRAVVSVDCQETDANAVVTWKPAAE